MNANGGNSGGLRQSRERIEGLLSFLPSFPGHKAKAVTAERPGPS